MVEFWDDSRNTILGQARPGLLRWRFESDASCRHHGMAPRSRTLLPAITSRSRLYLCWMITGSCVEYQTRL